MTKIADRLLRAACTKAKASPLNASESLGNNAAIEHSTHGYVDAATAMSALSANPSSWFGSGESVLFGSHWLQFCQWLSLCPDGTTGAHCLTYTLQGKASRAEQAHQVMMACHSTAGQWSSKHTVNALYCYKLSVALCRAEGVMLSDLQPSKRMQGDDRSPENPRALRLQGAATITSRALPLQSSSRACACQALHAVHCICCTFQSRLRVLE